MPPNSFFCISLYNLCCWRWLVSLRLLHLLNLGILCGESISALLLHDGHLLLLCGLLGSGLLGSGLLGLLLLGLLLHLLLARLLSLLLALLLIVFLFFASSKIC